MKPLGIARFKSIYPKIFMSSMVREIRLINKSCSSVIDKTSVAGCLEVRKKALLMIFTPGTFLIVILIIIPPVSEFVMCLTVTFHITYLTRQKVDQTFITTCKSKIDFINVLINKKLKCVSFYNIFANLANNFCYISLKQLVSLPLDKP